MAKIGFNKYGEKSHIILLQGAVYHESSYKLKSDVLIYRVSGMQTTEFISIEQK